MIILISEKELIKSYSKHKIKQMMEIEQIQKEEDSDRLLEEEQKWLIVISIKYFNLTQKEVSEKFNFHKGTVSKIITKYIHQNNVTNNYQNCGRKSTIEEYPDLKKNIQDMMEEDPTITLSGNKNQLNEQNYEISQTNVFNIMKDMDMVYKKSINQHLLTEENKVKTIEQILERQII